MKRIAIFVLFIIVLGLLVSCVKKSDADTSLQSEDVLVESEFVFSERYDGTLSILEYSGQASEVTLPADCDGKKVTSISAFAFENKDKLTRIVIPESITTIEPYAFAGCVSLADVELSESAVYISKESFNGTAWYDAFDNGFVSINGTLLEYKGLDENTASIQIPEGTKRIGDKAFFGLAIKSVSIPDSVTSIGERAFNKCTSLMKITFPEGLSDIGYAAFHDTAWFNMHKGAVVIGDVLVGYNGESNSIIIPQKVRTIAGGAFLGYSAIAISVPEGVENISDYAFSGCTQIVKINLPSTVSYIGEHAFDLCPTLQNLEVSVDNSTYTTKNGVLYDKSSAEELLVPEGKPAPESEKYDPRG